MTTTATASGGDSVASLPGQVAAMTMNAQILDAQGLLDAFAPNATSYARTQAIVKLFALQQQHSDGAASSSSSELVNQLRHVLEIALADGSNARNRWAATRLLSALFAVAATTAHQLLLARPSTGMFEQILEPWRGKDDIQEDQRMSSHSATRDVLALVTAELLCSAASHQDSRKALLAPSTGDTTEVECDEKIFEIKAGLGEKAVQPTLWLAAYVERAELENASSTSLLAKTALLAALALHKITRISAPSDDAAASIASLRESGKETKDKEEQARKTKEEDAFLFEMCGRFIKTQGSAGTDELERLDSSTSLSLHDSTLAELHRQCHLAAVEGPTYLSTLSMYRDAIADDASLLTGLCALGKAASSSKDVKARYAFPSRAASEASISNEAGDKAPDTAMQFAIATLIGAVCSYLPIRTKEQVSMDKLQRMASAKGAGEDDVRLAATAVEDRVAKVVRSGCIELLVAIALSGTASPQSSTFKRTAPVNPSAGVRHAVSRVLLSATTKQDKRQRGSIIQQGGARALVALSNCELEGLLQDAKQGSTELSGIQALAHLLITENPQIVLSDPTDAIASIAVMYMHSNASRLQQFEAALALTNIASLDDTLARRIATCSFPARSLAPDTGDFIGTDRGPQTAKTTLAEMLYERIMHEEHDMSRRASVELLCNLLTCDDVFRQWAGELEDEGLAVKASADETAKGRAARGLLILALLCAPGGRDTVTDEPSTETALKTRMAAGGALAMLCRSPSACSRILEAEPRALNRICTLIDPQVRPRQGQIVEISDDADDAAEMRSDAEQDGKRDEEDCASELVHGPVFARWQLAMRGVAILDSLLQYVQWLDANKARSATDKEDPSRYLDKFVRAGAIDAIRTLARKGATLVKTPTDTRAATLATVTDVTKQALELLRTCQQMGLLER